MILYCTSGYSKLKDGTLEEEITDFHYSNKEDAIGHAKKMQLGSVVRIDVA